MNVEICFLTNACQAGLPNLTKFNQAVHLADESSRRREREREREKERRGEKKYAGFLFQQG